MNRLDTGPPRNGNGGPGRAAEAQREHTNNLRAAIPSETRPRKPNATLMAKVRCPRCRRIVTVLDRPGHRDWFFTLGCSCIRVLVFPCR